MERNVEIDKISDGKRYGANDLVKVGCDDCRGCSACCHGMGDSIVLDPMDVYRLEKKLGKTMEEILLAGNVALRVVDGVILPHLKMTEQSDRCSFLNEEGRCSIHDARPGFCRMFPLGRLYEDGTFSCNMVLDKDYSNEDDQAEPMNISVYLEGQMVDNNNIECTLQYVGRDEIYSYYLRRATE